MIGNILLESIKKLIPSKLYSKLILLNIKTVGEINSTTVDDFRKAPYVGEIVSQHFLTFKKYIENSPGTILEESKKNSTYSIPDQELDENFNFLSAFKLVIDSYLELKESKEYKTASIKKRAVRDTDILRKTYGILSPRYDRTKIAKKYSLDKERIRQIIVLEIFPELRHLINGIKVEKLNCICQTEAIEFIQDFQKKISDSKILNLELLKKDLQDNNIIVNENQSEAYFILLLNLLDYNEIATSKYYFLNHHKFYSRDSDNNNIFLEMSTDLIKLLRERVIPMSFEDIVVEILDKYNIEDNLIRSSCDLIPEIEKIETNYQIAFNHLSSLNDCAYRILYEESKPLSYNKLLYNINKKRQDSTSFLTLESLKQNLRTDKNIQPIGKMGSWTLKNSKVNIESQLTLIEKCLLKNEKPMSSQEITNFIHKEYLREDVSLKSISSNLRNYKRYFTKLEDNTFILSTLKKDYADQLATTKIPVKKSTKLKSDEIKENIIDFLIYEANNESDLILIVKKLKKAYNYTSSSIYKVISENPILFHTYSNSGIRKRIELRKKIAPNTIHTKYKWNELKKILERELHSIFDSKIQPAYDISMEEALEIFFKIITIEFKELLHEQNALGERILPTLYKFYVGASDRNDKLNYLKQIVTSQEAYFKKLLYLTNEPDYDFIKKNNKGFGAVIDKLSKLDPSKNRYKETSLADISDFGKHCSRAYKNRNHDTHNAHNWTETEIIEIKTSCLVFMIYGAFEYNKLLLSI